MVGRTKPSLPVSCNQAVQWFAKEPGKHHQDIERLPTRFQMGQGAKCCIRCHIQLSIRLQEKNGVCMCLKAGPF